MREGGWKLGIGTDLIKFFEMTNGYYRPDQDGYAPRSLNEFLHKYPEYIAANLWPITLRLALQGYLDFVGAAKEFPIPRPWMNYCFFSRSFVVEELDASYGTFDFAALGFPYVRDHFKHSVKAIDVLEKYESRARGTGFLLEDRRFVTARHCIEDKREIRIDGWDAGNAPLKAIWVFTDERYSRDHSDKRPDLAILEFDGDPFPGVPGFRLQDAQVLDDVLAMGYPDVPNFDQMLVAETAQITAELKLSSLKSTIGQVVAQETSYKDNQSYLLISARVKGGSSGGPVIGREGKVVGIVTQLGKELAPDTAEPIDLLGYGIVVPTSTLRQLLQACDTNPDQVQLVKFYEDLGVIRTTSTLVPTKSADEAGE